MASHNFLPNNDPIVQFKEWFELAKSTSSIEIPEVCCLSTLGVDGYPEGRMVLLKMVKDEGFTFFTNAHSRKGQSLKEHPKASLIFYWQPLGYQVRVRGDVYMVSSEESDAYFSTRSRDSQLGAWASDQSNIMENRKDLSKKIDEFKIKYKNDKNVPRPEHWSGWCLIPSVIEFWLGDEFRIHERLRYNKISNTWKKEILYP